MNNEYWLTNVKRHHPFQPSNNEYAVQIQGNRIGDVLTMDYIKTHDITLNKAIDLQGSWIAPGFVDSHLHLLSYCQSLGFLKLEGLDREHIAEAVKSQTSRQPEKTWIKGRGWEMNKWKDGRVPDKLILDAVSPHHPVALSSKDGHSLWVNSNALDILNIQNNIPDISGGVIFRRGETHELAGVFQENAADEVLRRIPQESKDAKTAKLMQGIRNLHELGITAVHTFDTYERLMLYSELIKAKSLRLRVLGYFDVNDLETAIINELKTGQEQGYFTLGGLKLYADGALGSRTAAVTGNYTDEPQNYGTLIYSEEDLTGHCVQAADHQIATAIHAIGDRAVQMSLNALSTVRCKHFDIRGLRIEHAQLIRPEDIRRFREYQIALCIQPNHLLADIEMVERYWTNQISNFYPYQSLHQSGCLLMFGSDAPIEPPDPLYNIQAAVTRQRLDGYPNDRGWIPQERLDLQSAINATVWHPVLFERKQNRRGTIEKGKLADLVVLSGSPFDCNFRELREIKPVMTIMDGQIVFDRDSRSD
ncbi:amidohydrolase [bacterium]|nr:amidohydrolase [candidate division CSSED10-310 bacterium]